MRILELKRGKPGEGGGGSVRSRSSSGLRNTFLVHELGVSRPGTFIERDEEEAEQREHGAESSDRDTVIFDSTNSDSDRYRDTIVLDTYRGFH